MPRSGSQSRVSRFPHRWRTPAKRRTKANRRKRRRLPERRPPTDAFAAALKALNRRERSNAEIRGWLAARGFDPDAIDDAVAQLTEAGAIDDERFAACFAADRRELAGWGEERITAALIERGVARELAETVGQEPYSEQRRRAVELLSRRGQPLDEDGARGRALGFLTRRGFAYEVAYDAIREASAEQR